MNEVNYKYENTEMSEFVEPENSGSWSASSRHNDVLTGPF
jgi:hypothetical protein